MNTRKGLKGRLPLLRCDPMPRYCVPNPFFDPISLMGLWRQDLERTFKHFRLLHLERVEGNCQCISIGLSRDPCPLLKKVHFQNISRGKQLSFLVVQSLQKKSTQCTYHNKIRTSAVISFYASWQYENSGLSLFSIKHLFFFFLPWIPNEKFFSSVCVFE